MFPRLANSLRSWSAHSATRSLTLQRRMGHASFALALFLATSQLQALAGDAPRPVQRSGGASPTGHQATKPHGFVLKAGYGDRQAAERLEKRAGELLRMAACLDEFECRLSSELLSCQRAQAMVVDSPFEDVLLSVPVRGDAHVEATLKVATIPSNDHAAFELRLEGTVQMHGLGLTQGVRIYSDATTKVHAVKRLTLDGSGVKSLPASGRAETSFVAKQIKSDRPRLLGRITERVARQRIDDTRRQAENECSDHVRSAICAVLDHEVETLVTAMNRSLTKHLAASAENREHWERLRFRTEAAGLCITRSPVGATMLASWRPDDAHPHPAVVLRVPRAGLDLRRMLVGMGLFVPTPPAAKLASAADGTQLAIDHLHPTMQWHADALTLSFNLEPTARLAQEPVIGAAQ